MSNIQLKAMKIANFKGITSLDIQFNQTTRIIGANGTGKSSIYDAYMWCLFNKNQFGKEQNVQPLTKDNEVVHKVVTSVELILDVNGIEYAIRREQREDWQVPRGTSTEVLKGRKQDRYINEVPYAEKDFLGKIAGEICGLEEWFMLSSVTAFMSIDQDKRRKFLQTITGEIDEKEIAANYPSVLKALEEGKTVEELSRQNKVTRSKAKQDLDEIPARIDQQERLRVNEDVSEWERAKADAEARRAEYDTQLKEHQASRPTDASGQYATQLVDVNRRIAAIASDTNTKHMTLTEEARRDIPAITSEQSKAGIRKAELVAEINRLTEQRAKDNEALNQVAKEWREINAETFKDEVNDTCPVCGQALPAEKVEETRRKAIEKFNHDKLARLSEKENIGKRLRANVTNADLAIAKCEAEMKSIDEKASQLQAQLDVAKAKMDGIKSVEDMLQENAEYQQLLAEKSDILKKIEEVSKSSADAIAAYNNRTNELLANIRSCDNTISDANTKMASVNANKRIDEEKARLQEKEKELAQIIADCDRIDFEISSYKKAKISIVEDRVSSLFEIVHWKMYEPNLTNDGEKEICQAIIDGVPYEQTNTATRINAGIDIVNGISKAFETNVPLFIDNAESVSVVRSTPSQLITLTVVEGQELTIQ
jgi:DNA repair exonuclease SbcCD ATPase subunit